MENRPLPDKGFYRIHDTKENAITCVVQKHLQCADRDRDTASCQVSSGKESLQSLRERLDNDPSQSRPPHESDYLAI